MSAGQATTLQATPVVIRFRDNEILEGSVPKLDFDLADLTLRVPDGSSNNRTMIVPLAAIKSVLLDRCPFTAEPDGTSLRKAAIRFWDGDVLKGYLGADPLRHRHAMSLHLVSPALDEVEVLAIPYTAVKAIFFVKAWDGRPPVFMRETGHWTLNRADTPLLDLLGEIRSLTNLRTRGEITIAEFERRRQQVLDRI
ncbi:MAG: SHOCT domain-containing protein [Candidatus Dormibacteraeota bacterium]|nr:SHOCT domain-containing protein [Candidatus Dormibacteraeota bacterium]MBV9526170.1 SHOCT domain-containing protein [Candidatus Dormibacteraeota bacterium]